MAWKDLNSRFFGACPSPESPVEIFAECSGQARPYVLEYRPLEPVTPVRIWAGLPNSRHRLRAIRHFRHADRHTLFLPKVRFDEIFVRAVVIIVVKPVKGNCCRSTSGPRLIVQGQEQNQPKVLEENASPRAVFVSSCRCFRFSNTVILLTGSKNTPLETSQRQCPPIQSTFKRG